ncbi:mitochondrial splicing system protein [Pestalotiopsis sp. IQ-011]
MKNLFEEATQVWVWLGPGNGQSAEVIAKLPDLLEEDMEVDLTFRQQLFANNPKVMSWLSSDDTWSTFYDWYSRLWVFQEAAFAQELRVLLGSREVEWSVLERVIQSSAGWSFIGADGTRAERPTLRTGIIFDSRKIIQRLAALGKPVTGHDAATILRCTQDADCLEPRDRVFAILGFFAFQVEEITPLEDMYSQLALFMLSILPPASNAWWILLRRRKIRK